MRLRALIDYARGMPGGWDQHYMEKITLYPLTLTSGIEFGRRERTNQAMTPSEGCEIDGTEMRTDSGWAVTVVDAT